MSSKMPGIKMVNMRLNKKRYWKIRKAQIGIGWETEKRKKKEKGINRAST